MIVLMKKAFILMQAKDAKGSAASLRRLGLLHIENQNQPKGEDLLSLHEDISYIDKAAGILASPEFYVKGEVDCDKRLKDWRAIVRHIADLKNRHDQLEEYSKNLFDRIAQWDAWGDFDPAHVKDIGRNGVRVKFYRVPAKDVSGLKVDAILKVISVAAGMANCVLISKKDIELPYEELAMPAMGLESMKRRLAENREMTEQIRNEIRKYVCYRHRFLLIKGAFEKELELHEAVRGMGRSDEMSYISGYIPFDAEKELLEHARKEKWGIYVRATTEDDNVPTLVRNPKWIALISPVFKLIEIVPGYHELDISLWFLIFLSIFFGMLVGDAGYGLIFLILTLFAQFKWGKRVSNKSVFFLSYLMSLCVIVWGVLTGTFFGQQWLPAWVRPLAPALRNDKTVEEVCFLIGAVHLSIAHLWRAALKAPSLKALSDIGWTVILWGGFFLARMLVLGESFPAFGKWLFIVGMVLVIFFTDPRKNILKGVAGGFGSLLSSVVNSFTDIVSYVRLFAVGLATVAVADSFNSMAMDVGFGTVAAGALAALILFIGHTLNILLAPMSVLVHGVRLNVLEFCSHIDIKWTGFSYRPLEGGKQAL